jgi:hypothetical protein
MARKEVIKENIVEAEGVRTYEIEGHRVTLPVDWDDDRIQAWIEKSRNDMHLRRNLKMIKKNGSAALLRAFRQNGSRHGE